MSVVSPSSERRIEQDVVITGEAVALDVFPATVGSRVISGIIDYGIYVAALILTFFSLIPLIEAVYSYNTPQVWPTVIFSLAIFLWLVVVPLAVEVLSHGRSAGRLVTGTRIVRDDGGPIRFRHSLVRVLLALVEVWFTAGALAFAASAMNKRGKRLGDMLAGTYSVHDRNDAKDAAPLIMPPELRSWAREADLRELPGNLALVARTFLQRASTTDPAARLRVGTQLAAQVEPFVSPPPPPNTNPERFLAAVLVERRNREYFLALRDVEADKTSQNKLHTLPYDLQQ